MGTRKLATWPKGDRRFREATPRNFGRRWRVTSNFYLQIYWLFTGLALVAWRAHYADRDGLSIHVYGPDWFDREISDRIRVPVSVIIFIFMFYVVRHFLPRSWWVCFDSHCCPNVQRRGSIYHKIVRKIGSKKGVPKTKKKKKTFRNRIFEILISARGQVSALPGLANQPRLYNFRTSKFSFVSFAWARSR